MKSLRTRIACCLGLLPVLWAAPLAAQVVATSPAKRCPVAAEASPLFRSLEQALVDRDGPSTKRHAEALAAGVAATKDRESARLPDDPTAGVVVELAAAASAAAAAAAAGDLPGAGTAARRAGRACVLCHLLRGDGADAAPRFPARDNTIWGRVTVQDLDGHPRADHAGAVVFLDDVADWPASAYPIAAPPVSQRGRKFEPAVLPIVLGDDIEFPNDDTVFHNAFSLSKTYPFDLGIYRQGEVRRVRPTRLGLISVYCNIHSDMKCSILVLQNPGFAVTAADGTFVITGVPAGEFTLRTWHELGGDSERRVTIANGQALRLDLSLRESKQSASHLNKWGRPYRQKY